MRVYVARPVGGSPGHSPGTQSDLLEGQVPEQDEHDDHDYDEYDPSDHCSASDLRHDDGRCDGGRDCRRLRRLRCGGADVVVGVLAQLLSRLRDLTDRGPGGVDDDRSGFDHNLRDLVSGGLQNASQLRTDQPAGAAKENPHGRTSD